MTSIHSSINVEVMPVKALRLDSKLDDLRMIDFQLDEACIGEQLYQAFQANTLLPGVILTKQGELSGFISREKFLKILSRPFGREIYLRRPLSIIHDTDPFICEQITILTVDTLIFEAVRVCLQRPSEYLYEPIVVDLGQKAYHLLSLQDLLVAQTQIYKMAMLMIEERTTELAQANTEISNLNERLKSENVRMGAELGVLKKMQQMILPKPKELEIAGLDIAGFMEPADEVGGDYYDVLQIDDVVTICMGDVTGHGLESGILMLMTQTAVRILKETREHDPVRFLDTLNRTLYKNVQRMNSDKNLTLVVLNYVNGKVSISGQHEETIVVRKGGQIERIDTIDLGLPIALNDNIADFINHMSVELQPEDGIVLYTDGITEAGDINKKQYGLERLCDVIAQNWQRSANDITQSVIEDVHQYIGAQKVFDDIALLVVKQK